MDCIECKKNIVPYLNYELDPEELYGFYSHIMSCKSCRDDLEIYYLVTEGVELLDNKHKDYNLSRAFKDRLMGTCRELKRISARKVAVYAADTLSFWALLLITLMYLRILIL